MFLQPEGVWFWSEILEMYYWGSLAYVDMGSEYHIVGELIDIH